MGSKTASPGRGMSHNIEGPTPHHDPNAVIIPRDKTKGTLRGRSHLMDKIEVSFLVECKAGGVIQNWDNFIPAEMEFWGCVPNHWRE